MILLKPYPFFFKILDWILIPVMYLIAGTLETPQETHKWNLQKLPLSLLEKIEKAKCVTLSGTYEGFLGKSHGGIFFHIPILGGWKEYVVLEVENGSKVWHLGWFLDGMKRDYFEISRLKLRDSDPRVRVLKPPRGTRVTFFAVDVYGNQVPLRQISEGEIGDGSEFRNLRLL